jgi:hypothetical protein
MSRRSPWLEGGLADGDASPALVEGLRAAVPWWRRHYRVICHLEAGRRARVCGTYVGTYGDVLQFATKRSGRAAECFNRLAEGLAIASAQPGGITYAGLHFESPALPDPAPGCTIHWCARGGVCRAGRGGAG